MKIDFTLTDMAIEEIQAKGEKVTLKKIADISGYKYSELYNSRRFNKYLRSSGRFAKRRYTPRAKVVDQFVPMTPHPQVQKEKDDEAIRLAKEAKLLASVPPAQPRHPYFPADGSCKMTWRTGSNNVFVEINVRGVKEEDWFDREVGAFMCLEAFNKLMGRSGDRKIKESDIQALKP